MKLDLSLRYEPKRIISLVSPSRSGSSVIKYALSLHPEITSLDGEEEPYYKLAHNGYPWHASDEFHTPNNPELIRILIANEVLGCNKYYNRQWLQLNGIEEPPFVDAVGHTDPPSSTLLLKTPQNCYRRGVLEKLYPNATIQYVRIYRDLPAIVNGLIDGWESPDFTARSTPDGWWKFDMPPGWTWSEDLPKRCVRQAKQALTFMYRDYADAVTDLHYNAFVCDWKEMTKLCWMTLGLDPVSLDGKELPVLMATDKPNPDRWRTKRPWLAELC